MMRVLTMLVIAGALFCAGAPCAARAQAFNTQEQSEIRAIVRDYLVRNPSVLREALNSLESRTQAERRVRIETDPRDFTVGPHDAPITIVEFFDYRCPYCHASVAWVSDILRTRRDVRIVFKELPVLGPQSLEASRAAVASIPQGRYWEFHHALMNYRGDLSSDRIDAIARETGIDVGRMRAHMSDATVTSLLQDNQGLAVDLGINGTPGFMINGELVSGFRREQLEDLMSKAATPRRTAER
jgi:protein-disulfide isomerase